MNEIDFKELRRQERKKAHSRNAKRDESSNADSTGSTLIKKEILNANQHGTASSEGPYETLLTRTLSEHHRIHPPKGQIDSVYYTKNFLRDDTSKGILDWLQTLPDYRRQSKLNEYEESRECNGKWTTLQHARRKVALFDASIAPLPPILSKLANTLVHTNAFAEAPNHVLINEYQKGMGIMSHTDGPAYNSRTATISIGGDVLFKLTKRRDENQPTVKDDAATNSAVMEVMLHGCGSLIVFANDAYLCHCHGIDETLEETTSCVCANEGEGLVLQRDNRVSLTFRCKK